jgi:phosphatidylglycerol---prolipoprotein diacylglyceryl transferase
MNLWHYLPFKIDPVLVSIGPVQIRYYGLMFMLSFLVVYHLLQYRVRHDGVGLTKETVQNYFLSAIVGVIIGGRLGYILIYNWSYYAAHPVEIILPVSLEGGLHYTGIAGMSYHGGLIVFVLVSWLFCHLKKIDAWNFGDFIAPTIPLAYTLGRIGNFLNDELYGRVTTMPWGMYFPSDPIRLRHPSQLYEALFEGLFLFIVMWPFRNTRPFKGFWIAIYFAGYGAVRFLLEFFREPDVQLGFVAGSLTMGQVLCLGMIGIGLLITALRFRIPAP